MDCRCCGYWWADLDEYGAPMSLEYCHYEGPDEWAPCVQNDYYAQLEAEEAELRAEAEAAEEEYERWLEEQARLAEDEEHWTHEFGQPYDYQEF